MHRRRKQATGNLSTRYTSWYWCVCVCLFVFRKGSKILQTCCRNGTIIPPLQHLSSCHARVLSFDPWFTVPGCSSCRGERGNVVRTADGDRGNIRIFRFSDVFSKDSFEGQTFLKLGRPAGTLLKARSPCTLSAVASCQNPRLGKNAGSNGQGIRVFRV